MSSISRVYKLKLYKNAKHESIPSSTPTSPHGIANVIAPIRHASGVLGQHVSYRLSFITLRLAAEEALLFWHYFIHAKPNDLIVENTTCQYKLHLSLVCMERFVV
jgi:hypothetical protein